MTSSRSCLSNCSGRAKAGWWVKTVWLDLEAKGILKREKTTPLRLHKVRTPGQWCYRLETRAEAAIRVSGMRKTEARRLRPQSAGTTAIGTSLCNLSPVGIRRVPDIRQSRRLLSHLIADRAPPTRVTLRPRAVVFIAGSSGRSPRWRPFDGGPSLAACRSSRATPQRLRRACASTGARRAPPRARS